VTEQPDTQADFATILPGPGADRITPLQAAMARIEGRGAERLR
jgi:hypothetical protein